MLNVVQVVTVLVVAVAMALSLAHALELPGKMRLSKEAYYTVQPIYYPGFTCAGFAEPAGIVLTILLLFMTALGYRGVLAYSGGVSRTQRCVCRVLAGYPSGQ